MRYILILLTLVLVACGPDGKHIAIDGRLLNLNQGEFLVYSPDGATKGVDTIDVAGGRFDFSTECQREGTVVILMAGGQEIPVFVKPGKGYTIKGDAQNLKALEVKGGEENKLMNAFRKSVMQRQKGEIPVKEIKKLVEENPASPVAMYLVGRYLVSDSPDTAILEPLLSRIKAARKDDAAAEVFTSRAAELTRVANGAALPKMDLTDINGKKTDNTTLGKGTVIITSFATWDYESLNQMRRINTIMKDRGAAWHIVGISFDASQPQVRNIMSREIAEYTIVCDGKMTETPAAQALAMTRTGIVVIARDGKIIERSLCGEPLYEKLKRI
ncbi:MAG: DUF4369 domain-containing protein [Prevotella sp.]